MKLWEGWPGRNRFCCFGSFLVPGKLCPSVATLPTILTVVVVFLPGRTATALGLLENSCCGDSRAAAGWSDLWISSGHGNRAGGTGEAIYASRPHSIQGWPEDSAEVMRHVRICEQAAWAPFGALAPCGIRRAKKGAVEFCRRDEQENREDAVL